jgi:integrating conjugative element protein (TIGR03759 family)
MIRSTYALALVLVSGLAMAESTVSNKTGSGYQYTDSKDTFNQQSGMSLTPEERSMAKQWMLTENDWVKFKAIMDGPRGIWSPGLDPITALGVSEKDPRERDRYAEIWMRVEGQRKQGEMDFERSRAKAVKVVFGDLKTIENDAWIAEWNRKQKAVTKIVAYFVESSCLEDCKQDFERMSSSLNKKTRMDIYFEESVDATAIGAWAEYMGIDPEDVRQRGITLNFDKGTAARMGIDITQLPQIREIAVE